jgi:hypothetical protein
MSNNYGGPHRYPDEISRMTNEFRQTGVIGTVSGLPLVSYLPLSRTPGG